MHTIAQAQSVTDVPDAPRLKVERIAIAAVDRLVVIDQGRIVQQGSHVEPARADGLCGDLWRRQSGDFIP